jgi:hypothetical protein
LRDAPFAAYVDRMPGNERVRLEAELAAVERKWINDQERYLARAPDGSLVEPAPANMTRCIALMVGSVVGMALLSATPLPPYAGLVGLVPFAYGTFRLMIGSSKAESFERCRTEHETRRAALLRRLHELSDEF